MRRRLMRLQWLPLRPITARSLIGSLPEEAEDDDPDDLAVADPHSPRDLDPGWILTAAGTGRISGQLSIVAERSWWPAGAASGPHADLLNRLWRHSVAVGIVARRLARDAGDPDPEAVARAGQLCGLGWWAVASVDPEWLAVWWRQDETGRRESMEQDDLGSDLDDLGRRLAERWGCDPLVVDAAWLHDDPGGSLNRAATSPGRLAMIQEAFRTAEQTPWSLRRLDRETPSSEPRLRILMAEVQARCGAPFVDPSATPHEERVTRQNARLRLLAGRLRRAERRAGRFVELLAGSPPAESPEEWADRAAMTWCAEPGVGAARIAWLDAGRAGARDDAEPSCPGNGAELAALRPENPPSPRVVVPLNDRGPGRAVVQLWGQEDWLEGLREDELSATRRAWGTWAALLADRSRLERRLHAAVASFREHARGQEERLRRGKLEALGEFAAGAGHELNNPLAVIVGRAQLLLARAEDPEVARSLRIILGQAQRTHRILRDLMFVARPPAPRLRSCKPPELLGSVLSEFERECQSRGVRLLSELDDAATAAWGDPDGLRHLAEILLRNALQATPPGGRILVRSSHKDDELMWSFSDNGKGIGADEAEHLFDPFFCGRQAGRGLGLGLPRAAKIVELAGGRLRWTSGPGHETTFQVHLPLAPIADRPAGIVAAGPHGRPAARAAAE